MSKEKHTPAKVLYVCTGEKCRKRGGKEISKLLRHYVEDHKLEDTIGIIRTHCTDNCKHGPVVCLQPGSEWHFHVDDHKAISLLKKLSLDERSSK
jgi:NADH:ubiquinone oxidoreductase subunit E